MLTSIRMKAMRLLDYCQSISTHKQVLAVTSQKPCSPDSNEKQGPFDPINPFNELKEENKVYNTSDKCIHHHIMRKTLVTFCQNYTVRVS